MSDLRIRSEAMADGAAVMPFLPPAAARHTGAADDDDSAFQPFLAAAAQSLGQLFGAPVTVLPGRSPGSEAPPVAPQLAALLATLRMGGSADHAAGDTLSGTVFSGSASGVALTRFANAIAHTLEGVAARVWPAQARRAGFDLDIACGAIAGHAHVLAPPPVVSDGPPPRRLGLDDPLLKMRVELAGAMVAVASLLPLRAGTVLPIAPVAEMPLVIGDHIIGRATVTPLADGRQQARIVALGVLAQGGRA